MPLFYKGVPANSFLSNHDFQKTGLGPRNPGGGSDIYALMSHIRHGTTTSGFTSLTRSYGIAEAYAYTGLTPPTASAPGYVWVIRIDGPVLLGFAMVDPVYEVMSANNHPLAPMSYHHTGDPNFIIGVVDPINFVSNLTVPERNPPNSGAIVHPPNLSPELETLVRALRDAELLIVGNLPGSCFVERHAVY